MKLKTCIITNVLNMKVKCLEYILVSLKAVEYSSPPDMV